MPTFCRHGRFIERCPICRGDLPGATDSAPRRRSSSTGSPTGARASRSPAARRSQGATRVRVSHEQRAADDGYRDELVAGLRASDDARRLADELALAVGMLARLGADAPGPAYGLARAEPIDVEQATWACFLAICLGPSEESFASIAPALTDWRSRERPDLDAVALGPGAALGAQRGGDTLEAYRRWAARSGSQREAIVGDPSWDAERRFARAFERLALPGLGRGGRFRFLVVLGALGLYELRADALHLLGEADATELAAKRVFGIGDVINLERRARALADAVGVALDALDLALANWAAPDDRRIVLGSAAAADEDVRALAYHALGVD